ncbi:ectoine hydroxylase [Streptomyces iconiensis]|uniref:Ectoine hydroxylase n=1 Tax=Streptomyces iconiensis TaxID=1384038 RepID=A0ABT6ZQT9_9ACTN|nr:ectoine hydroxylase [Streptomyces iconiensis]MDJ1131422.1 ectoine hydroxylase [Streptomyces iconiensis]
MTTAADSAKDLYPTRSVRESVAFARPHPVVWGQPADGPLDAGDLDAFDRDGFLVFEDLLDAREIAACLEETERLGRDPEVRASGRVAPEPDAPDGIRSVFEVHALSGAFARVISGSRLADVARQLLGSEVYVHQSRVNLKTAFDGSKFGWHADFETWHSEDGMPAPRALSFSVALTRNEPFNGPLMIIPGSHRTFVPSVGETPPDYHKLSLLGKALPAGPADRATVTDLARRQGIRQFTGPAGSAVLFDCNCLHASAGNVSPFPRTNLFVVFNSVENGLGEPFAAPAPRPGYLASRDITPLPRP